MNEKYSERKLLVAVCFCTLALFARSAPAETLSQYVAKADDSYSYKLKDVQYSYFHTTYIFEITSQQWHKGKWELHSEDIEDNGLWKHWLRIIEPRLFGQYTQYFPFFSLVRYDTALLYLVRGDAAHKDAPSGATLQEALPAIVSGCIIAEIDGIPLGPVAFDDEQPKIHDSFFCDEDNPLKLDDDECYLLRSEDSLQARSFDLALSTGDFSWALMAPMTKAAIRAMDVAQTFLRALYWGRQPASKFVVAGHSKRGHVSWLTAALDPRVAAVVPVSFDLLNFEPQIALQDASWPARSPEQDANMEFDLYDRYKTELGRQLIADLDPYAYRADLGGIPALVIVGTGDPYSCSDAAGLYISDFPGARVHYVPNAGHDIRENPEVASATMAFFRHVATGAPEPAFTWSGLAAGVFTVTPGAQKPLSAKLWTANSNNRDFRQTEGSAIYWASSDLVAGADGSYSGTVGKPAQGYLAYYIEMIYADSENAARYSYATPLTILGP